jgi:hypothetical protein
MKPPHKTDLSRRSQAKAEALVSVLGKFGVSDQLRNILPNLQAAGWENETSSS